MSTKFLTWNSSEGVLELEAVHHNGDGVDTCTCSASRVVGDLVRISGDKVGDYYPVELVDITDLTKMPVYGAIIEKITSTQCYVQWSGKIENVYTGLTPRSVLFVDYSGRPTSTPPAKTVDYVLQTVGYALDSTTMQIKPDYNLVKRVTN